MQMTALTFTPEKVKALRKYYNLAVKDGREQFTFAGHVLLTEYAKYLLEYLDRGTGAPIPLHSRHKAEKGG